MPLDAESENLYREMDRNHVQPLWRTESSALTSQPRPKAVPWIWKWSSFSALPAVPESS